MTINNSCKSENMASTKLKALFVCTMNKWRSRTAESIFKNSNDIHAKSAGTSKLARIKINSKLIEWADIIFVMEKKHQNMVLERFNLDPKLYKFVHLEIEDNYKYMDDDLIQMLKDEVEIYI